MTNYKNMTKDELITMLENEKHCHEITTGHLREAIKDYQKDQEEIQALKNSVFVLEKTVLRLNEEETIRQEMENNG